jgi:hypothetical protein
MAKQDKKINIDEYVKGVDQNRYNCIYLLYSATNGQNGEKIYKFGKTYNVEERFFSYPKNSTLLFICRVKDCNYVEDEIYNMFFTYFIHHREIGYEFFETSDVKIMINYMNKLIDHMDQRLDDDVVNKIKKKYKKWLRFKVYDYDDIPDNFSDDLICDYKNLPDTLNGSLFDNIQKDEINEVIHDEQRINKVKAGDLDWLDKLQLLKNWIDINKTRPCESSKNPNERNLGKWLIRNNHNYDYKTRGMKYMHRRVKWDEFMKEYKKYIGINTVWNKYFEEAVIWFKENKRMPLRKSKGDVQKLYFWIVTQQKKLRNNLFLEREQNEKKIWSEFVKNNKNYFRSEAIYDNEQLLEINNCDVEDKILSDPDDIISDNIECKLMTLTSKSMFKK